MAVETSKIISAPVIVLIGPTAVGKTSLSLKMAEQFNCEIVSVDSVQVYRYMDIGTAKPTIEEQQQVKHHIIDIISPDEQYNSALFVRDALSAIDSIISSEKIPLLTGGTGMYLKALTKGLFEISIPNAEKVRKELKKKLLTEGREALFNELLSIDPESAARIHVNDTQRLIRALEIYHATGQTWTEKLKEQPPPPVTFTNMLQMGLNCDRAVLYKRIEQRSLSMLENGLLEETEKLIAMGFDPALPSMQSIGYKHACNYLSGKWDKEETVRLLMRDTRRYAKRQMTWFGKNHSLKWFDREDHQGVVQATEEWLSEVVPRYY